MMYMVDLSGSDAAGHPKTERFGGLFMTIEAASNHALDAIKSSRLHFRPDTVWVRDEANDTVRRESVTTA